MEEGRKGDVARVACAASIDVKGGGRIWIPPRGRPYWCHVQPTRELTDSEIEKYGITDSPIDLWHPHH